MPGDDTITQLSKSTRSVLREQTRDVRKQAATCQFTIPSGAPPPIRAISCTTIPTPPPSSLRRCWRRTAWSKLQLLDLFRHFRGKLLSFRALPWRFRLAEHSWHRQAAYRAYQLLHGLGTELLQLEGSHATVDAWLVRGDKSVTIVLTNFALPRHPIATESVSFVLKGAKSLSGATIQRIDLEHANAKRRWEQLGEPEYLSRRWWPSWMPFRAYEKKCRLPRLRTAQSAWR